ncbi:MAG TPA: dTDP-4-dehydrorhamnose reductase [Thermoplasmata archaeon]
MATLLVIGGSGLLGSKLAVAGRKAYRVVATYRATPPKLEGVELVPFQKEAIGDAGAWISRLAPDYVVDAAAFHDVDRCEDERERAAQVNARAPGVLAEAANGAGARYLFVSTDFVFDGTRGSYEEADPPGPVNHYGRTKLEGERAVLDAGEANQVVRPSVIYGWDDTRLNFATWLLTSLRDRKAVRIVTDWIGSPTWADSLADAVLRLLALREGGIYHLAGPDRLSRFEFATRLAAAFDLDPTAISPVTAAEFPHRAPRPRDSSLRNTRAANHGITVLDTSTSLQKMRAQRSLEKFETPVRFKS